MRTIALLLLACLVALPARPRAQQPAAPAAPATPAAPAAAPAPAGEPAEFGAEARLLFDVVSCQGAKLPPSLDAKAVAEFCKRQKKALAAYRDGYLPKASAFLAKVRPAPVPPNVVYPFGGGDLLSALTTYPDARDVTTLSLEHAGDPRRLAAVTDAKVLADSLEIVRATSSGLLYANDSKTENLMKGQRGEIPGQLAFFMTALAVHGYEPVSLRFFRIEPDGSLRYLTRGDIAATEQEGKTARLLRPMWTAPDFSPAFSNSELVFVKRGEDPATHARVHRHVAADLSDPAVKKTGIVKLLASKGPFAAMTKAASYLLWRQDFSRMRELLLGHMAFMISDSTGIPPRWASKAGFVQETYGTYEKAFLDADAELDAELVKLWASEPRRPLPIRYGYIDGAGHTHLMVTKKAP